MEIRTTYIGVNENGTRGIWCGFKPQNFLILKEKQVLYPELGKILQNKETKKEYYSIILENGDSPENYIETEERNIRNDIIE